MLSAQNDAWPERPRSASTENFKEMQVSNDKLAE